MALVNFSPHAPKSFTSKAKQSSKSSRIAGTGPNVVAALFNNILDYMKNRRVRLLDLFGMLSNEKKVITIASLQKALPVIGINSTVSVVAQVFTFLCLLRFYLSRPCIFLESIWACFLYEYLVLRAYMIFTSCIHACFYDKSLECALTIWICSCAEGGHHLLCQGACWSNPECHLRSLCPGCCPTPKNEPSNRTRK